MYMYTKYTCIRIYQMPKWCMSEAESRDGDEETDSVTSPTKRPIHSSLSGSDGPASLSPHPPPAKRRKEEPQPRGVKSFSSSAQVHEGVFYI